MRPVGWADWKAIVAIVADLMGNGAVGVKSRPGIVQKLTQDFINKYGNGGSFIEIYT